MTFDNVIFTVDGSVAAITFNRPEKANAMDLRTMKELMAASIACDEDPRVRVVVITGAGRFFSAGGDLAAFADAVEAGALVKEMTAYLHAAVSRLSRMKAPIVAAVNGMAAGAGLSLVAASDLAVAAESAQFASAYTAAGLSPDGSSTYFLPRLVGMRRAMELILTNRRLSAEEAVEWGLVNRVVPDDELAATTADLAAALAVGPPLAHEAVKDLLHAGTIAGLETQMELEARAIARLSGTRDGREGVAAFVEKRRPGFVGE